MACIFCSTETYEWHRSNMRLYEDSWLSSIHYPLVYGFPSTEIFSCAFNEAEGQGSRVIRVYQHRGLSNKTFHKPKQNQFVEESLKIRFLRQEGKHCKQGQSQDSLNLLTFHCAVTFSGPSIRGKSRPGVIP